MKKYLRQYVPRRNVLTAKKYAEMSHGEKVVRRNVPRRNVLTVKCPHGEMSHGEVSHSEKSHGEMSGHGKIMLASLVFKKNCGIVLQMF